MGSRANHYRDIAAQISDGRAANALHTLAEEYEALAEKIETQRQETNGRPS